MSFNRLIYDDCYYKKNVEESINVGNYQLYGGKYDNKNNCRIDIFIETENSVYTCTKKYYENGVLE